jgi:hypothetical protein
MQAYVPILDEKYASNHQFETVPYPVYYSPAAHPHMPGTNLSNLGPSEQQQQRRPVLLISNVPPQLWRSEQPVQAAVNYYAPQGYFPRTSQQFPPTAVHDYTSPQFPITVTSSAPTTTSPLSDLESATAYPSSSESESSEERENENNNETKGYSTESPSSSSSTNFSTQIPQYIQQYPAQAINSAIDFGTTYSQAPMAPVQLPASKYIKIHIINIYIHHMMD